MIELNEELINFLASNDAEDFKKALKTVRDMFPNKLIAIFLDNCRYVPSFQFKYWHSIVNLIRRKL